jgi:hypothetical protein
MMTTTEETKTPTTSFDLPSVEQATQQMREVTERLVDSSKSAALVALDAYEKAMQSFVQFEEKVASASQVEWVTALATKHAKFTSDASASCTKAARDLLK